MVTTPLANVLAGMRHASRRYGRPHTETGTVTVVIAPNTRAFHRAIEQLRETDSRSRYEAAIRRERVRAWQWQTATFEAAWARYGWERPPRPEVRE